MALDDGANKVHYLEFKVQYLEFKYSLNIHSKPQVMKTLLFKNSLQKRLFRRLHGMSAPFLVLAGHSPHLPLKAAAATSRDREKGKGEISPFKPKSDEKEHNLMHSREGKHGWHGWA